MGQVNAVPATRMSGFQAERKEPGRTNQGEPWGAFFDPTRKRRSTFLAIVVGRSQFASACHRLPLSSTRLMVSDRR